MFFSFPAEVYASSAALKSLCFRIIMILEFRIPLPLTVEDFQVAQLDMVIKAQEKVTGGGEGIVVLKNEPYDPFFSCY